MVTMATSTQTDTSATPARKWLDPRHVARKLRETLKLPPGFRLARVSVGRVFPAKIGGVGIQYDVVIRDVAGVPHHGAIFLCGHAGRAHKKLAELQIRPEGPFGVSGVHVAAPSAGFVFQTPDRDERLPTIRPASNTQTTAARRFWAEYFDDPQSIQCRCLSYRPGRRCVLAYHDGRDPNRSIVGKLYKKLRLRAIRIARSHISDALARHAGDGLIVPQIEGTWRDMGMVLFSGIPRIEKPRTGLAEAACLALACLHRGSAAGLRRFDIGDQLHVTRSWIDLAARFNRPHPATAPVWNWLERTAERLRSARAYLVHRDFYDNQLIPTSQGWGLVDFDTLSAGDRELDLGNFIAHQAWNAVRRGESSCDMDELAAGVIDAYFSVPVTTERRADGAPLDPRRLTFYLVSTLLRVALIHSLRTTTADHVGILFELALATTNRQRRWPPVAAGRQSERHCMVKAV